MMRLPGVLTVLVLCAAAAVHATTPLEGFFANKLDVLNGDGSVTFEEFRFFLGNMDRSESESEFTHVAFSKEPSLVAQLQNHFSRLDTNGDGLITYDEFVARVGGKMDTTTGIQEVHVSMTNASTYWILWLDDTRYVAPLVNYGTSEVNLNSKAFGVLYNYTVPNWSSMNMYAVELTSLAPSTRYFYTVGGVGSSVASPLFNFTTAPEKGSTPAEMSWAIFGDMGTVIPMGQTVFDSIMKGHRAHPFEIALHVGDLAYAGVNSAGEFEPVWDVWVNQIQPLAAFVPYQTSVGNHENYYNFAAYRHRFRMPGEESGGDTNFFFSFDYGNVHVTSMDTETSYNTTSPQYEWFVNDLSEARKRGVTWLFVAGHRPYYCSDLAEYSSHSPGCPLLNYLEPVMIEYGVNLVFTGHMHCYERTYPVKNGTVIGDYTKAQKVFNNPPAPIYVVQGTAGALILEHWVTPQPEWSAVRIQQYGYGRLNLYSNNTLHYEYYAVDVFGHELGVLDDFWVVLS